MINPTARKLQRRLFTLAELMVAMIVLMLIVYMLFEVVGGAQKAWKGSRAISEMHDTASLALDVIARDVRAMKASDVAGAEINYSYNGSGVVDTDASGTVAVLFAFVTSSGLGVDSSDNSMLSEVAYGFNSTTNTLYRYRTTYSATSDWDFYNADPTTWASITSWEDSTVLATGVSSISFSSWEDPSNEVDSINDDSTVVPSFVNVALTVHDQRKEATNSATLISKSKLAFSKTIHLNRSE
jgi:hypothetical protein